METMYFLNATNAFLTINEALVIHPVYVETIQLVITFAIKPMDHEFA